MPLRFTITCLALLLGAWPADASGPFIIPTAEVADQRSRPDAPPLVPSTRTAAHARAKDAPPAEPWNVWAGGPPPFTVTEAAPCGPAARQTLEMAREVALFDEYDAAEAGTGGASSEAEEISAGDVETAPDAELPPRLRGEGVVPRTEVRAPRLSPRRPSPLPMEDQPERTLSDLFTGQTGFDTLESALQAPDWTQPLRDIEADTARGSMDGDLTVWEGNVRLRLDDTFFRADEFQHVRSTGEMIATGNVVIQQAESLITADQITYRLPEPGTLPPPSLLESIMDEQQRARRRLQLGTLTAHNIRIVEPYREFQAEYVKLNLATSQGEMRRAEGGAGVVYMYAEELEILGPQSFDATGVWMTTCETPDPPYKVLVRELSIRDGELRRGRHARLQLGRVTTPLYVPFLGPVQEGWRIDFDSGREAKIGLFANVGAQYQVSPDLQIGPRVMITEKEGVGLGADLDYDFTQNPASRLYRSRGTASGLYTTEDRGYIHWRHRYTHNDDLVLRMQSEHWSDESFYKDFFFKRFRDRTNPRTFANVTYRQPGYIATGTTRLSTHSWSVETERLPEATFHVLERQIAPNLYFSYDTVLGYNRRDPDGDSMGRMAHVGRVSWNLSPAEGFAITPFYQGQLNWYGRSRFDSDDFFDFRNTVGVTAQTRLHRSYPGRWGFSGFKHIIVPSITYSYQPDTSNNAEDIPRFDSLDNNFGRSRIESKIENIVYGRDAESGEVWQVARLALYQGNDFWNEARKADDYEIEIDIRPRPWWGMQLVGERHIIHDGIRFGDPFFFQQLNLITYERLFGRPYSREAEFQYNMLYADYARLLGQLYYDTTTRGGRWQGRLGYSYTETRDRVYNSELLYGAGYKLSDKWGVAFEHRYDFEDSRLRTQTYEIRRSFECWESSLRIRDRESGIDIDVEFNIIAFPGTRLRL